MKKLKIITLFLTVISYSTAAFACDLCSIYNGLAFQKPTTGAFRLGITEQFSEFGTLKEDGKRIDNEMHQRLLSSITQVVGMYDVSQKLSFQINLPYINRTFTRVESGMRENGVEAGFGDMSLLARYSPYQYSDTGSFVNVQLIGGIKLPTGDSRRLKEELSESEDTHHHEEHTMMRHAGEDHESASAVHGHDLAIGSGSVDYPIGVSVFAEQGRSFVKGGAVYTIRTAGDYSYQYADDFMWDVGPGYFFHLDHDRSVAARIYLSGENKSMDSGAGGALATDTGLTTVFWGPELTATLGDYLMADLAYERPVSIDTTGLQAVTSYRLKAGITVRF